MKRIALAVFLLLIGCSTFQTFNPSDRKTDVLIPIVKKQVEANQKIVKDPATRPATRQALTRTTFLLDRMKNRIAKLETDLRGCSVKVRQQDQKIADLSRDAGKGQGIMGLLWGGIALLGIAVVGLFVWKIKMPGA